MDNAVTEDRCIILSKISTEKELLNELINIQPFYDIIDNFTNFKEKKTDLVFKK